MSNIIPGELFRDTPNKMSAFRLTNKVMGKIIAVGPRIKIQPGVQPILIIINFVIKYGGINNRTKCQSPMIKHGKAGILIVGIFIGMISGIALASWMDYMGYEINPFHGIGRFLSKDKKKDGHPELNGINMPGPAPAEGPATAGSYSTATSQTTVLPGRTVMNTITADSTAPGTLPPELNSAVSDIQIETDQLLESRVLPITGFTAAPRDQLDSLLLDHRGGQTNPEFLRVELWYSPINYKGYKWANGKLSIFGLTEMDFIKIVFVEGKTYLKHETDCYYLEQSTSFRNLYPVQDPILLKKIISL